MAPPSPDELIAALGAWRPRHLPDPPGRTSDRQGAVLVPLIWEKGVLTTLLTLRARGLRLHGGEVSFPGGKPDPEDKTLGETALREAREELDLRGVALLGPLGSVPLYNSTFRLTPFLGHAPPQPLTPEPGEVAEILTLDVMAQASQPLIHGLPWVNGGELHLSPVFEVGEHKVFGATAHVLHELVDLVARAGGMPSPALGGGRFEWIQEGAYLRVGEVPPGRGPKPWLGLSSG